jgi:hypothetical protein
VQGELSRWDATICAVSLSPRNGKAEIWRGEGGVVTAGVWRRHERVCGGSESGRGSRGSSSGLS